MFPCSARCRVVLLNNSLCFPTKRRALSCTHISSYPTAQQEDVSPCPFQFNSIKSIKPKEWIQQNAVKLADGTFNTTVGAAASLLDLGHKKNTIREKVTEPLMIRGELLGLRAAAAVHQGRKRKARTID